MTNSFISYIPTRIVFGAGSLNRFSRLPLPEGRALVVTGRGRSVYANGILEKVTSGLEKAGREYVLFPEAGSNPTDRDVLKGSRLARESGCGFVIGLGGGSSMDCAKAIALMTKNDGELWDYMFGSTGGKMTPENGALPVITVPTTAGTGSECNNCAVISKPETREKLGLVNDAIFPVMAVVDPETALSVPPMLTAYQGFDALMHACESVIHKKEHPLGRMYADRAIALIAENLPKAVRDGSDIEARSAVSLAAMYAGAYMLCTSEHSLEHALSAYHPDLQHGAGLALIAKSYWEFEASSGACGDSLAEMAALFGRKDGDFTATLDDFMEKCGLNSLKMSDFGIERDEMAALADNARKTMGALFAGDPARPSVEDAEIILEKAWK